MQQCEKSAYFATSYQLITARCDAAPCGHVQHQHRHYDTVRHLLCQSCASHAHVGDLRGNNAAQYSCPSRPFILLQYQVTQTNITCQWPTAADRHAMGQSVLQSRAQLTASASWKNSWPANKSTPPDFKAAKLSQIFWLVREYNTLITQCHLQCDNQYYYVSLQWCLKHNYYARYDRLIDWVQVSCPTRHKIGHFGNVPGANLLAWYGKTKPNTTKAHIHQSKEMYYNTK